jgi:hypothetical protein
MYLANLTVLHVHNENTHRHNKMTARELSARPRDTIVSTLPPAAKLRGPIIVEFLVFHVASIAEAHASGWP